MKETLIMTPGPTGVPEDIRRAMSYPITNPDLDEKFFDYYRETCERFKELLNTGNDVLILCGEGILGLEAACASLIEPHDRVLCIDNGIFGNGFGDFEKMYGGDVVYFKSDYRREIDVKALEEFLKNDHDFKVATLVHCETPSGITNPIETICPLLKKYGIITVVDSVSGIGGEVVKTDEWKIDILLGGSQKCLSSLPGLTFLSISDDAWNKVLNRKVPVAGFYANLSLWKGWYEKKEFPYTQPVSNIYALRKALDRVLDDKNLFKRHRMLGNAVRQSFVKAGLELYPLSGFSNTVTAVNVPDGIAFNGVFNAMVERHNIMIAGAFGILKDKVIRIGHMGDNCSEEKLYITLKALNDVLKSLGVNLKEELHKAFISYLQ